MAFCSQKKYIIFLNNTKQYNWPLPQAKFQHQKHNVLQKRKKKHNVQWASHYYYHSKLLVFVNFLYYTYTFCKYVLLYCLFVISYNWQHYIYKQLTNYSDRCVVYVWPECSWGLREGLVFSFCCDRVIFIDVRATELFLWNRLRNDRLGRGGVYVRACVTPLSVFVCNV